MDLNAGPEYKSFREQVVTFLNENSHMAGKGRTPVRPNQEELEWQKKLIENGADILVAGSSVFKSKNPRKKISDLKKLI